ncbi:GGDEF domain-containing protein [Aliiglaciecola sp. LCG003]|uniref:GGDEF domain-containing protein n=1 Tax=Aliiglaciecola sp. LCG003 TaxID=3053655 RepID=UPI002572E098|nr:GGDEF domain-containing protein [Aliiglaciecola sp. LCG003]WJG10953.1 GGDEF domain-containing protein [Aliiglaciecola sp. LCG003]
MKALKLTSIFFIVWIIACPVVFAQSSIQIDEFIQNSQVETYDCPADHVQQMVEEYLALPTITAMQGFQLKVMSTQHQVCVGKYQEAKNELLALIKDPNVQMNQEYFADAIYQLGFIADVYENPERCGYYSRAKNLAENKYSDISLSSELGLITMCNEHNDEGIKLGKLYAMLERYSAKGNSAAAVATIHNSIGLLYGELGQHVLAAEQYQKTYELGFNTYSGSNRIATLISVISSLMASGEFDQAKQVIDELKVQNQLVDTPLSNVWLHFAEAGYHYRTGNIDALRNSLARWKIYLDRISSPLYEGLFKWYSAVPCLADGDKACLTEFLAQEKDFSPGLYSLLRRNKDFVKFKVEIALFFGDIEGAQQDFQLFSDMMFDKMWQQQASGKVLGVANLHGQVLNLEASLEESENFRIQAIVLVVSISLFVLGIILFFGRKKYLNSKSYDSATNLLNNRTALAKIRRVPPPSAGRTNALALFDLGNFREVNRQIGATNSDLALQQIAHAFSQVTRDRDILGRFAPEQFIVCLTDIEEDSAKSFFERMRYALENTMLGDHQGDKVSIQSSMSVYVTGHKFDDLDEVLDDMQLSLGIETVRA